MYAADAQLLQWTKRQAALGVNSRAALSWRLLATLILDVPLSLKKAYLQLDLLLLLWEKQVFISGHLNTTTQCAGPTRDRTPCDFINACQHGCSATMKLGQKKEQEPSGSEGSGFLSKMQLTALTNLSGDQLHAQLLQAFENTQPVSECTSTQERGWGGRLGGCVALCCVCDKPATRRKKNPNPASKEWNEAKSPAIFCDCVEERWAQRLCESMSWGLAHLGQQTVNTWWDLPLQLWKGAVHAFSSFSLCSWQGSSSY